MKAPIEGAKMAVSDFQSVCSALTSPPMFLYPGTKIDCHLSPSMSETIPGSKGATGATVI